MANEQKSADARQRTLARELEWVRMVAAGPARRRARPAWAPTSSCSPRRRTTKDDARELEIAIPPGPRLGDPVIEVEDLRKGYGDRLLIEDLTFSLPRAGIVGIIGAQRRRQDDAVPDARRPGAARRRRRSRSATPCS